MVQFNASEYASNLNSIANSSAERTQKDIAGLQGTEPATSEPVVQTPPAKPLTDAQLDANLNTAVNNLADHLEEIAIKNSQATKPEQPAETTPAAQEPKSLLSLVKKFIGTARKY